MDNEGTGYNNVHGIHQAQDRGLISSGSPEQVMSLRDALMGNNFLAK
jgi:hypothetical protein